MCGSRRNNDATREVWEEKSTGNVAFDEYRADTLRRLEDEFNAFQEFLEQLRLAKDKEEFDKFMTSRKQTGPDPSAPTPG